MWRQKSLSLTNRRTKYRELSETASTACSLWPNGTGQTANSSPDAGSVSCSSASSPRDRTLSRPVKMREETCHSPVQVMPTSRQAQTISPISNDGCRSLVMARGVRVGVLEGRAR